MVVLGLGRHKPVALWAIGEATANPTLSIVLVRRIGITGVAIGTLIPNLCIHLVACPQYLSRILEIPRFRVLLADLATCCCRSGPFRSSSLR